LIRPEIHHAGLLGRLVCLEGLDLGLELRSSPKGSGCGI
jgi:hypothetical protein